MKSNHSVIKQEIKENETELITDKQANKNQRKLYVGKMRANFMIVKYLLECPFYL